MPQTGRGQLSAQFLRRYAEVIKEARTAAKNIALEVEKPERTVVHRTRDEVFQIGDQVLLKRHQAGTSFPQDKMSKLYVGPFTVEAQVGSRSYRLQMPSSMRVNPVQHLDNLFRPDQRVHFPPRDEILDGTPDEPLERLTATPLVISRIYYETMEDSTLEVFADTALGKFKLHDLCIHLHYDECVIALNAFSGVTRKWPFHLGKIIKFPFWKLQSFISGYDPNDTDKAYQLEFVDPRDSHWGPRSSFTTSRNQMVNALIERPRHQTARPLRALEICCGSKSFARQLRRVLPGAEIITLDINGRFDPDIQSDIISWNYLKAYPVGHFDIIWASPPCTEYSPAKTHGVRNLVEADRIASSVLNIIKVAKPRVWFIENPHTMLYKRTFMQNISHLINRCTYCKYGFLYKKDTDIWSNISLQLKHCDIAACRAKTKAGRHELTAQQSVSGVHRTPGVPRHVANFIPPQLLRVLITAAIEYIKAHVNERITWK